MPNEEDAAGTRAAAASQAAVAVAFKVAEEDSQAEEVGAHRAVEGFPAVPAVEIPAEVAAALIQAACSAGSTEMAMDLSNPKKRRGPPNSSCSDWPRITRRSI